MSNKLLEEIEQTGPIELSQLCSLLHCSELSNSIVNTEEFVSELIDDLMADHLGDYVIIQIIYSLIKYFELDIHLNDDILLATALTHRKISVAEYLVELGCDPTLSIVEHQDLFTRTSFRYEFIKYCIEKHIKIDWLWLLPEDHIQHLNCFLSFMIPDTELKNIISYLMESGYEPTMKLARILILSCYIDTLEYIIDLDIGLDIGLDINKLLTYSLRYNSNRTKQLFLRKGAQIDIGALMSLPVNENTEFIVNLLFDSGCKPYEIIEIVKRLSISIQDVQ